MAVVIRLLVVARRSGRFIISLRQIAVRRVMDAISSAWATIARSPQGKKYPYFLNRTVFSIGPNKVLSLLDRVANLLKQFSLGKLKAVPAAEQGIGKAKKAVTPTPAPKKAPVAAAPEAKSEAKQPTAKAVESATETTKAEAYC